MATNTAASFTSHTGNNSAGPFSISFSYLSEDEIDVTVDGVLKTKTTHYTFPSATTISFTSGNHPANSAAIKFQRDTNISAKKVDFVDGAILTEADLDTNTEHLLFGLQEVLNHVDTKVFTSSQIADSAITTTEVADASITAAKLHGDTVVINSEQAGATANDTSFFTTLASDSRYFRQHSSETILSGVSWSSSDGYVASTAAIDARIIDLVDDVGGFVPIANETSFPDTNPDINNPDGAGTLISIKALASNLVSNGSGVATISNGNASNNATITINGLANSTTYAAGFGMIVETTSTLHTYTFHRQTPKATEVTTVAGISGNITTVAGISSNVTSVAGNSSNINSVNSNSTNINTVAGSISNVNTVAGSITNINTVVTNLAAVNSFANTYSIADADPSSNLNVGDLYFNTTGNELKVYNGSSWQAGVTATGNLISKSGDTFTGDVILNAQSDLRFADADSTHYIGFQSPSTITSSFTLTLPATDAAVSGYVLASDGSGTLSWVDPGSSSSPTFTGDATLTNDGALIGFSSLNATYTGNVKTFTVTVATKTVAHRYNGTGSSSGYKIDGKESPFLTLTPGRTYKFDQADGTNSGHPLLFYLDAAKAAGYSTGVTTSGTPGSAGAYTQIVVSDTTPQVLHYQCSAHASMGNSVQTNSNIAAAPTEVVVTAENTTAATVYPTFVGNGATATGKLDISTDTGFTYNPSTGMLTSTGFTGALTGNASTSTNATNATNVTVADESSDTSCYLLFVTTNSGTLPPKVGSNLTFNSDTGILTATGFAGNVTGNASGSSGSCTGNAATATTATTATNVTVADESSDTSCNVLFTTAATGDLAPKSGTNLTFNSSTGELEADILKDSKGDLRSIPQNTQASAYELLAADAGKHILASGNVTWVDSRHAAGDAITIVNNTAGDITIIKGTTMYNTADGNNANRTLASRGMATILWASDTVAYISGAGLS